jgi:hypothetical protein
LSHCTSGTAQFGGESVAENNSLGKFSMVDDEVIHAISISQQCENEQVSPFGLNQIKAIDFTLEKG